MNDRQVLIQEQRQEQRQMQTLSQQQVLHAQLVELPSHNYWNVSTPR